MIDVENILAKLSSKNNAYYTLTKVYDLLKDNKSDEAKELIESVVGDNNLNRNPNNILYRILNMVYKLSESNYSFNDIVKYHVEYKSIMNISCFGNEWIYGDNEYEITEVSKAIVSMASDMLPPSYNELLINTSKFTENEMYDVHEDVEFSLIKPVSEMMMSIERIHTCNIHNLICDGCPVKDILKACDKLEE